MNAPHNSETKTLTENFAALIVNYYATAKSTGNQGFVHLVTTARRLTVHFWDLPVPNLGRAKREPQAAPAYGHESSLFNLSGYGILAVHFLLFE